MLPQHLSSLEVCSLVYKLKIFWLLENYLIKFNDNKT